MDIIPKIIYSSFFGQVLKLHMNEIGFLSIIMAFSPTLADLGKIGIEDRFVYEIKVVDSMVCNDPGAFG